MREFKPMVKMETTEPTVELKLKKGGAVKKMADGGMPMGAMIGAPRGGMMAGVKPGKPSLAARRRAMMASGAAGAPAGRAESMMAAAPAMKEGGKADMAQDKAMIKKAFMQHDTQEHKGGKGTKLKLKSGGMADKMEKFETKTTIEGNEGPFKKTKMHEGKADRVKGPTGVVKESNAGGFKTGGVVAGQGGFRKGGAVKKFAEGGRVQHDGGPEQMKQGKKKPAGPVSINQLSGTYKKGGAVMMAAGGSTQSANAAAQMADMRKNAAISAQAAAQKAATDRAKAQKAAAVKASTERAALDKASQEVAIRPQITVSKPNISVSKPSTVTPVRPEIQYIGPKGQGTIYTDGSDSGKNPGVRVSQTPSVMPMPKPVPMPMPKPMVSEMPQSGYGGDGGGMRRGGKVQYNGKKRGGAVC